MTYAEILGISRAFLNDVGASNYTNAVLLPYLNVALAELQEEYQLNGVPVTNETSAIIEIDSGTTSIPFPPAVPVVGTPYLPTNLVEILRLWYSKRDQGNWSLVNKEDFLTQDQPGGSTQVSSVPVWSWQGQEIRILSANTDLDLKLDYVKNLFAPVVIGDINDEMEIVGSATALGYRVAGLASDFIDENGMRADKLNASAERRMNTSIGISTKSRQSIPVRRRPFRASYKGRGRLY